MALPENHHSNFPDSWWNERRRRDYFVDSNGLVQVRPGSDTAIRLGAHLKEVAVAIADSIGKTKH